jgi:hypothetical protein
VCQSDNDSGCSEDKSDGWECEEDKAVHFFVEQARKEDQMDFAVMIGCLPVAEVEEWMDFSGERSDDADAAGNGKDAQVFETVKVPFANLLSTIKS